MYGSISGISSVTCTAYTDIDRLTDIARLSFRKYRIHLPQVIRQIINRTYDSLHLWIPRHLSSVKRQQAPKSKNPTIHTTGLIVTATARDSASLHVNRDRSQLHVPGKKILSCVWLSGSAFEDDFSTPLSWANDIGLM